jgi:hypothetical protein
VLEAEQLPAGIANLDTGLTDVDGKSFTHFLWWIGRLICAVERRW